MKYLLLLLLLPCTLQAQLQPGFDAAEYREMLQIFSRQTDSIKPGYEITAPEHYKKIYRSPESGLKNRFEIWQHLRLSQAVISIRGTIPDNVSWLENFYAAMTPATGNFNLNDSTQFSYKLAADSAATVHIGWLVGLASVAQDVKAQMQTAYQNGIRQFIIFGHSQGAAIAFLLRSYLHYETEAGRMPADMILKTYCSAAPKPGNLMYAYDYDAITRNGWGLTVVNTADWVPQTPFSAQTLDDFPASNPFTDIPKALRTQPLLLRVYIGAKFKKLNKTTRRSQKLFEKYLGTLAGRQVSKVMPQLKPPPFAAGNNYQRAGTPVVLVPDAAYWQRFPAKTDKIFIHHLLEPYFLLVPQGGLRKSD